jgi:hypothetical protein
MLAKGKEHKAKADELQEKVKSAEEAVAALQQEISAIQKDKDTALRRVDTLQSELDDCGRQLAAATAVAQGKAAREEVKNELEAVREHVRSQFKTSLQQKRKKSDLASPSQLSPAATLVAAPQAEVVQAAKRKRATLAWPADEPPQQQKVAPLPTAASPVEEAAPAAAAVPVEEATPAEKVATAVKEETKVITEVHEEEAEDMEASSKDKHGLTLRLHLSWMLLPALALCRS